MAKASRHLAAKEVDAAAAVYVSFKHRGAAGIPAAAATNLSFLYLLEGDLTAAAHYTDLALKADRCAARWCMRLVAPRQQSAGQIGTLGFRKSERQGVLWGC